MTLPKAVIFDIGNVLIEWQPQRLYAELIPDEDARRTFFEIAAPEAMNDEIDRGAPFRETVYEHAEKFPQYRDLIRAWHDRWLDMASPSIPGSWAILRELKSLDVPVFALSNFGVESFAYAETIYPVLGQFDQRYISGHMKLIKPDPQIYAELEAASGLQGAELAFFDDRHDNIAAAKEFGWQAHVFTDPNGMLVNLNEMGLLCNSQLIV